MRCQNFYMSFGLLISLMVSPTLVLANAKERETCARGIERAGFSIEEPYTYDEPGFFSRASHTFGVFTCEVNADGTINKILRGQSVIAEDGLYGVQALKIRELIEASAEDRRDEARKERDAAIEHARNLYEDTSGKIDGSNALALQKLRKGELHDTALSELGFTKAEIAKFRSNLGLREGATSEQMESPKELKSAQAEAARLAEESERVAQEQKQENERRRERAKKTFPLAMKSAESRNFTNVRLLAGAALQLDAWSEEEIKQLEALVYAQVRPLPAAKTDENLEGYRTLVVIAPDNADYRRSLEKYSDQQQADADAARKQQQATTDRAAKDRFDWIASRLSRNNSEAQRQYAFEQVENKPVVASGRVSDVERAGILVPPTITIDAGYDGLTVFCRLPRSTSDGALASVSLGQRYECRGTASSYTFIFGSASMSVDATSIK